MQSCVSNHRSGLDLTATFVFTSCGKMSTVGLVVKASTSRATDLCSIPAFAVGGFPGRHTSDLVLQWLPCQAPGVIGSVLGLVGPVSVYCDWVRWKVWSATSISVWQFVQLSEQISP